MYHLQTMSIYTYNHQTITTSNIDPFSQNQHQQFKHRHHNATIGGNSANNKQSAHDDDDTALASSPSEQKSESMRQLLKKHAATKGANNSSIQTSWKRKKSLLPCLPPSEHREPHSNSEGAEAKPTDQPESLLTPQKTTTYASILKVQKANPTIKNHLMITAMSLKSQTEDYSDTNHSKGSTIHPTSILTAASRESSEGARWDIQPSDKGDKVRGPAHRKQDWQEVEQQDCYQWQEVPPGTIPSHPLLSLLTQVKKGGFTCW